MSPSSHLFRPALAVALLALTLAGCGRRGPLEEPPSADAGAKGKTTTVMEESRDPDAFGATNVIGKPTRGKRAITIPKRDFVLDPLL